MEEYITDIKTIQALNLELMIEFDQFCREKKISYYLGGGTLIGAVRHKGFIPWDDDTDIMMLRKDYEKLLSLKDEFENKTSHRQIVSIRDKTFARDYARYIRKDYHKEEAYVVDDDCPYVGMDIFPIVFVPDTKIVYLLYEKIYYFFRVLMSAATSKTNSGLSRNKKVFKNLIRPLAKVIGKFRLAYLCEKIGMLFDSRRHKYVAAVSGMAGTKERWLYRDCKEKIELQFEENLFWAPANYDIYLRNIYGGYMELPPEKDRKTHSIRVRKIEWD
ncbi:LicD family protein [Blautia marasmi]|uniref:LicD family protein n=1 Tax=Blautia marasmi TaxID=1917868 RepID=UPI000CF257CD|nr:LicD family protein [Blautia marasmi]